MIRGDKIKYYRGIRNLTQKELATGICSIPYLSKVENSNLVPSHEILELLCERLQIDMNEISPKETIDKLKKEILNWYEVIKLRDLMGSSNYYTKLSHPVSVIDDVEVLGSYNIMCARHFLLLENYDEAKRYLHMAQSIIPFLPKNIVNFYFYFKGLYEYLNGNLEAALEYYLSIKGYIDEPEYFYQLGLIYTRMNKISLSIVHTEKALVEFNKRILFSKVIDCYILLGVNYNRIGEFEEAKTYLSQALKGTQTLNDGDQWNHSIYHNLGCVYQKQKKSRVAIEHFLKAIEQNKSYTGVESTVYMIANEWFVLGEIKESLTWIDIGLNSLGDTVNTHTYLLKILHMQLENRVDEEEYLQLLKNEALPFFEARKDLLNMEKCYKFLADYYTLQRQYKSSNEYFSKAYDLTKLK
jgi:tetratricopeptide (TPR) repeat protein